MSFTNTKAEKFMLPFVLLIMIALQGHAQAQPGRLDLGFTPPNLTRVGFPAYKYAVTMQPDGKILVGGEFDAADGVARAVIARLNPNGTLDTTFNTPLQKQADGGGEVYTIVVQPDGKILVGGFFAVGGVNKALVRLMPDGSLDTSLNVTTTGGSFGGLVYRMVLQSDSKIVIAGNFLSTVDGTPVNGLARLNSDGSLDAALGVTGAVPASIFALALQTDGKILAGGSFATLTRLNPDGTTDISFTPAIDTTTGIQAIALQADGKILVGVQSSGNNPPFRGLQRLNPDGSSDGTFTPVNIRDVSALLVQNDGKIVVGGSYVSDIGLFLTTISRLNPDGSRETYVADRDGTNSRVEYIARQADGKVILVGGFTNYFEGTNTYPVPGAVRLLGDGTTGNTGTGNDVSVQAPAGDAGVTFSQVTTAGNTTFTPINPNAAGTPPSGFTLCPTCPAYDITTTATYVPPVTVCLDVPAAIDDATFNAMALLHGENGVLVDVTTGRVTNADGTREVCGQVSSLSPFVLAQPGTPPPPPPPAAPSAPSNLRATAVSTTQINLTWQDNSDNEINFELERCDGKGKCRTFMLIASPGQNAVSHADTDLQPGSPYAYRVRAVNAVDASAYSNTAKDRTPRR